MKLDKETLLKQRFWVMLGVAAPLAVIAIFILLIVIGAEIGGYRDKLQAKVKAADSRKKDFFVNDPIINTRSGFAQKTQSKEHEIWEKAWKEQAHLFTWPEDVETRFHFKDGMFANEIKLQRGGAPPAAPPKGAAENQERILVGTITALDKDTLQVQGTDQKEYTLYRTARYKLQGDDASKVRFFEDMKPGDAVTVRYEVGKYFNDPLTDSEQAEYTGDRRTYLSQIEPIYTQVQPVDERGEGVVQLRDWPARKGQLPPAKNRFLRYLPAGFVLRDFDISEEAWLAQQEIWINREIYRLIRLANDYVSKFEGDGGEEKNKSYTYKNPYLEIAVKWDGGYMLDLTFRNLLNRRQKLDIPFLVRTHKEAEPERFTVGGEPLNPAGATGDTWKTTIKLKENLPRKGIYELEQVLNWETAAVKRIDLIHIGDVIAHSQRTLDQGTRPLQDSGAKLAQQEAAPGKFAGDRDSSAPAAPLTQNGLNRNCYVEVTSQTRRLPVAISLIVDQDHIDRVQSAFANSKLRFLITQLLLNRYPGSLRPQISIEVAAGGKKGDGKKEQKGGEIEEAVISGSGLSASIKSATLPPDIKDSPTKGGAPVKGRRTARSADDMEANVEMVIYGLVTIYQRYPPPVEHRPTAAVPPPVAKK